MDKRGFIKTLEAIIAIIIIFSAILILNQSNKRQETPASIEESYKFILTELSENSTFRNCIKTFSVNNLGNCKNNGCLVHVDSFVGAHAPYNYNYLCEVCDKPLKCSLDPLPIDKNVYTNSVFIAHNPSRISRIYFWQK